MCKQKILNLALVRVIITTVLIIAMAVTSAPIAQAADTADAENVGIATAGEVVTISAEYEALENKLIVLKQEEFEQNVDLSQEKIVLVERQIMILYQEVSELEQKTDWYLNASNKSQKHMKVEQAKLDNKQKTNAQKIQTINQNIASACVDVLTNEKPITSIIGQVSAMKQVAIDNQRTTDQMAQIGSGNELIQGILSHNKEKITNLNSLIAGKRQEAYQYLQNINNENLKFGNLVEINKYYSTVLNVDKQGTAWADPCVYTTISSPFGYRIHPIYQVRKMHNGVDLTNVSNTPIYATRSGVVVDSSYDSSSGYHVVIDHLDGYESCYLHLRKQSNLKVGDVVIIGDYVGAMGTTGISTGTHLHFGISYNNQWVNPMNYIYNH